MFWADFSMYTHVSVLKYVIICCKFFSDPCIPNISKIRDGGGEALCGALSIKTIFLIRVMFQAILWKSALSR